MSRYGGFAEMSKAERAVVSAKSVAARRSRTAQERRAVVPTLTYEQGVESGKAVILARLRRLLKEESK